MKVTAIRSVNGALGTIYQRFEKGLKDLEIRRRDETIQKYRIAKITQNTEKSPG